VATHVISLVEAPREPFISGRATFTTLLLIAAMTALSITVTVINHL
jgi:hypothetical protein